MKKIYFIMALGLATLSGCSDFLDQNNKSNVPSAEFYQTSAGFASLTNSAYVSIRPRACFFPLFSFLPLWLHYNLNPLCVQY